MSNPTIDHITSTGHMRWAFKTAQYYWFVGGATDNEDLQGRMRYRIVRDVETLGARCRRLRQQPVALLTATQATPLIISMLKKFPGWRSLVLGERGLDVPNADKICINTADVILCYGEPSEYLLTLLDEQEKGPELVRRKVSNAGRVVQRVHKPVSPYSRYWADVDRLRKDRQNPNPGLNIRDEIDMRPKMDV